MLKNYRCVYSPCLQAFCLAVLSISLTACSSVTAPPSAPSPQVNVAQKAAQFNQLLSKKRVVMVGETHSNYAHHLNQLTAIKLAHARWGKQLSIGLEMVQQPFQQGLDDYIAHTISEREMLKQVEWYSRWRYDFRLYRPIFNYARTHRIPLIALNIPREVTKQVSKSGIAGLKPAQRAYLPEQIDKSNRGYRKRLTRVYRRHLPVGTFKQSAFERFYEAQLAWDEGMALAASRYLQQHPKRRMVLLAGSGHLLYRHGIPSRLERLLGERSPVLISYAKNNAKSNVANNAIDTKQADLLWPVDDTHPNNKLPPAGLIGIRMADSKRGVAITHISSGGAADVAGLKTGDILLAFNHTQIKTTSDVSLWRLDKRPNQQVTVKLKRGKAILKKVLKLQAAKTHN